jgi:SAM-dependent methyltransferase
MALDARIHAGSPDRFGYSWSIFRDILPEHREQFLAWSSALPRERWRGAFFLDAGCGIGRNSYWAMAEGAAGGIANDVDERSVAIARKNLRPHSSLEVRKQSIYESVAADAFDIVFSIGVIHHLAEPRRALAALVQAAKPEGYVLIWVYGAENMGWLVRFFDPVRRILFSRLPLSATYHLSLYPTAALWVFLRLWPVRLQYLKAISRYSFAQLRVIVFDQMIPRIANYWTKAEVEQLLVDAGLEHIRLVWVNEMSWSAAGRKPRTSI